jgi:putative oxidoreductase
MSVREASRSLAITAGRVSLSWIFIRAGSDVFRDPARAAGTAGPLLARLRSGSRVPLPGDHDVVRMNAAIQVAAGIMIATNVAPRLAAGGLIGSMIPTTLAGHSYWTVQDPALRPNQRNQFNKNLAVIGGLLLLAAASGSRQGGGACRLSDARLIST